MKKTWNVSNGDILKLYKINTNIDGALVGLNGEEPKWLLILNDPTDALGDFIRYNDIKYYL